MEFLLLLLSLRKIMYVVSNGAFLRFGVILFNFSVYSISVVIYMMIFSITSFIMICAIVVELFSELCCIIYGSVVVLSVWFCLFDIELLC
jgi:hypothetical protein